MSHVGQRNVGGIQGAPGHLVGGIDAGNGCADAAMGGLVLRSGMLRTFPARGVVLAPLDGMQNAGIPGAAAQVACERVLDLVRARIRVSFQQR